MTNYVGLAILLPVKAINYCYKQLRQFGQRVSNKTALNYAEKFLHNSLLAYSNVTNIFGKTGREFTENLLLEQFIGLASQLFRLEQQYFTITGNYTILLERSLCFDDDKISEHEKIISKALGLEEKNISIKLAGNRSLEVGELAPKGTLIALRKDGKESRINTTSFCYYNIEILLPKKHLKTCIKSALKSVCSDEISPKIFDIMCNAIASYKKQESDFRIAERIANHVAPKIMIRLKNGDLIDMRTLPQKELEAFVSGKIEVPNNTAIFAKAIIAERRASQENTIRQ